MILVSFFSEDNVLSYEIKIRYIFEFQSDENRAFRFFFGTPDINNFYVIMWHALLHGVFSAYPQS